MLKSIAFFYFYITKLNLDFRYIIFGYKIKVLIISIQQNKTEKSVLYLTYGKINKDRRESYANALGY